MMVTKLRRSLSLPGRNNASPATNSNSPKQPAPAAKEMSKPRCHVRSTSLPCPSHPLVSQLDDEIRSLRSWQQQEPAVAETTSTSTTSSWLRAGFSRLELLHGALDELLQLSQTQDALRRRSKASRWADRLLDDFLRLADAYGRFREALVTQQQLCSEAYVACRRREGDRVATQIRARKKAEKEIANIAAALKRLGEPAEATFLEGSSVADAELAGALWEVRSVVAAVSATVFLGFVAFSTSSFPALSTSSSGTSSAWATLRKKLTPSSSSSKVVTNEEWGRRLQCLKGVEACIAELETGSERVFRCLINTRVSLLNTLTP